MKGLFLEKFLHKTFCVKKKEENEKSYKRAVVCVCVYVTQTHTQQNKICKTIHPQSSEVVSRVLSCSHRQTHA